MFVLPVMVIQYIYQNVPDGQHQRRGHKIVVQLEYFSYMICLYYPDITLDTIAGQPHPLTGLPLFNLGLESAGIKAYRVH